jgi:hypothetical protein
LLPEIDDSGDKSASSALGSMAPLGAPAQLAQTLVADARLVNISDFSSTFDSENQHQVFQNFH